MIVIPRRLLVVVVIRLGRDGGDWLCRDAVVVVMVRIGRNGMLVAVIVVTLMTVRMAVVMVMTAGVIVIVAARLIVVVPVGVSMLGLTRGLPDSDGTYDDHDEQCDAAQEHRQKELGVQNVGELALPPEQDADKAQRPADADVAELLQVIRAALRVVVVGMAHEPISRIMSADNDPR
jgi:hypothetical protein